MKNSMRKVIADLCDADKAITNPFIKRGRELITVEGIKKIEELALREEREEVVCSSN